MKRNSDCETILRLPRSPLPVIVSSTVRIAMKLSMTNLQLQLDLNTVNSDARTLTRQTMCMTTEKCAIACG